MTEQIEIGRVLRASTSGFVVGCRVNQLNVPAFGALVRAPLRPDYQVYGIIHDIQIEDDGLVRQLITAQNVSDEVVLDNRERQIVPVEISVIVVGYEQGGHIHHQLPPRPPLSLDLICLCDRSEVRTFTSTGRFSYFRHLLRIPDLPVGELLAAHIRDARPAQEDPSRWSNAATQEIILLLRDDYPLLTSVLGALDQVMTPESRSKSDT
jgi:hypothetical protein